MANKKRVLCLFMALFVSILLFPGCSKEEKSTMVDWEGNVYKTRNYGGQWWMVENLRTTTTKDGRKIWVSSDEDKFSYTTPYCYFVNDNEKTVKEYGCLYNWAAANQVCPDGWHLPSVADYKALTNYIRSVDKYCYEGDTSAIASAMASKHDWVACSKAGTPGGEYPNVVPYYMNNASGFDAHPAGFFSPFYEDYYANSCNASVSFWMSDEYNTNRGEEFRILYNETNVVRETCDKSVGISVRCVKD